MTMENFNKNAAGSDDEDDIQSLRLAALKSLKPKTTNLIVNKISENKFQHPYKPSFGAAQTTRHHNRGFRNNSGRAGRNGLPSRIRTNTNLISIQTIDHEQLESTQLLKPPSLSITLSTTTSTDVPKLILPQDRYHKSLATTDDYPKELSRSNKFNRYDDDNSDESESDSSESPQKPVKRERKDSLEMLMEELDNEINGLEGKDTKSSDPDEIYIENVDLGSPEDQKQIDKTDDLNNSLIINESDVDLVQNVNEVKIEVDTKEIEEKSRSRSPYHNKHRSGSSRSGSGRSRSPKGVKSPTERSRSPRGVRSSMGRSRSPKGIRSSTGRSRSPKGRLSSPRGRSRSPRSLFESQYRSPRRSPPRKMRYSPNRGYGPLPPLTINTEVLNTITMAPLSPRSAAFVLENRQILARRQKSPIRRSLSRDRSCSLSPKRYRLSPLRRRSPPRFDSRKCSLSPRNRSFSPRSSPKRRSTSPRTRRSPPRMNKRTTNNKRTESPKTSVHKRLGSRPVSRNPSPPFDKSAELNKYKHTSRSISLSLSPSPDRSYHKRPLNETTGYIPAESRRNREKSRKDSPGKGAQPRNGTKIDKADPVLEARKRKFESPIQIEKNGIIKLKTKTDEILEETKDEIESPIEDFEEDIEESDIELDDSVLDLNPNLDDLWSDEESDNENEGRFKSKPTSQSNKNITILPFRKLLEKSNLKQPLLPKDNSDHRIDQRRHAKRPRTSRRSPPRSSEVKSRSAVQHRKKEELKVKIVEQKRAKTPEVEKKKERKEDEVKKVETVEKIAPRKVKIQTEVEPTKVIQADDEPEIVIENEDEANPKDDDGDLRAELSRRRAERLIKAGSIAESLPARLLKSALQEVVPRTSSKHSKTAKGDSSSTDRRVLILKRLASSPDTKLEPANKVSKKEKKLPIHMRLGSSNALDLPLDEIVRSERRPKRARSSRRNKKAGVQV